MENKQQTAVDFLTDCYRRQGRILPAQFEQAKKIEKDQIINSYDIGHNDGCHYITDGKTEFEGSEQYYNETYENRNCK